jgi:hypothetical protein
MSQVYTIQIEHNGFTKRRMVEAVTVNEAINKATFDQSIFAQVEIVKVQVKQ